jgi:hypothetical protein
LDNDWRANGVLHILDVLKWKGQDIGGCKTPFRSVDVFVISTPPDVQPLLGSGGGILG